jgi:topoisomerase-4 subunit A
VWYDPDVNRLNYDEHGRLLGEFFDDDSILVILNNGDYYLSGFDPNVHFEDNIQRIEKYEPEKVWSCVLYDADNQGYPYLKRFQMEATKRKQNYIGENVNSQQILLTDTVYPRLQVTYGGNDAFRGSEEIDVEQFIAVKGFKAKGKRLTTWQIASIEELEPLRFPEPTSEEEDSEKEEEENLDPDSGKSQQQVLDEMTGQLRLFDDDNDV